MPERITIAGTLLVMAIFAIAAIIRTAQPSTSPEIPHAQTTSDGAAAKSALRAMSFTQKPEPKQ